MSTAKCAYPTRSYVHEATTGDDLDTGNRTPQLAPFVNTQTGQAAFLSPSGAPAAAISPWLARVGLWVGSYAPRHRGKATSMGGLGVAQVEAQLRRHRLEDRVRGWGSDRGGRHRRDPRVDEDEDAGRGGGPRARSPRSFARRGRRSTRATRWSCWSRCPPAELPQAKRARAGQRQAPGSTGRARTSSRLTISNPAKRNALDHPILDAITATLAELGATGGEARCVIVTGAHRLFFGRL